MSAALLGNILQSQGNLGIETKELLELSLAIDIENYGQDGIDTALSHFFLGNFFQYQADQSFRTGRGDERGKELLRLSESKYEESIRINTKIFGPDDPRSILISETLCKLRNNLMCFE
jgi:hypothetical protein